MKEFRLHEGQLPESIKEDFPLSLFNRSNHLRSQNNSALHSFYFLSNDKAVAVIHFNIDNGIAVSLPRVPFGSVEFSKNLSPEELSDFLDRVEQRLAAMKIKKIIIKNAPLIYVSQKRSLLEVLLLNRKYVATNATLTASIGVDPFDFRTKIRKNELRRLKKCEREQFLFKEIGIEELETVYDFISNSRKERNQSLSMTLHELKQTVGFCPGDFFLFGVFSNNSIAAASVSVVVNKNVLYNFYPARARAFDTFSPMVMLIEGMYRWCQSKDIKQLDLGTSSVENKLNFSLLNFKLNVGGSVSEKLTFEKQLL